MITPPTLSEADVRLAAAGDRSAYERIVRRCAGLVTSIALSVVQDVGRSEDVAQEVFVAAWKDLSKLQNPRTFLPWLRGMARNLSLRALRDRHVPTEGAVLERYADEQASAADRLVTAERDRVLSEALMALEVDDREVLLVYYREGMSLRQVASLLDLSEPAARKRLSRARSRLRAGVEERLGQLAAETAPGPDLAASVIALLPTTLGPTATAATAAHAMATGGKLLAFWPPILMMLGVLGGMAFSVKKMQARARDDEERRGIQRYGLMAGSAAALAVIGMCAFMFFEAPYWTYLGLWTAYTVFWNWLLLGYLPRVSARRLAMERAEDPSAATRQRRERRVAIALSTLVTLSSVGSLTLLFLAAQGV